MASALCDYPCTVPTSENLHSSFEISKTEEITPPNTSPVLEIPVSSSSSQSSIPAPPPLPRSTIPKRRYREKTSECCCISKETRDLWDKLFKEGYGADVYLITEDDAMVPAHFCVLVTSMSMCQLSCPFLNSMLLGLQYLCWTRYLSNMATSWNNILILPNMKGWSVQCWQSNPDKDTWGKVFLSNIDCDRICSCKVIFWSMDFQKKNMPDQLIIS